MMEKEITFKAVNKKKGLLFAGIYMIIVLVAISMILGFTNVADFIDRIGHKASAIIAVIIIVLPAFLMMRLIYPTIRFFIESNSMMIYEDRKMITQAPLSDIHTMTLNVKQLNMLELKDAQSYTIYSCVPFDKKDAIQDIARAITAKQSFRKSVTGKKYFGQTIDAITYTR